MVALGCVFGLSGKTLASELVPLPYGIAKRQDFTADGRFLRFGNQRYEVRTQRLVTLPGPTADASYSLFSGNGQVQFGTYWIDNWNYAFRRTAGGFAALGGSSSFGFVDSDESGQNAIWESTFVPHGGGTITTTTGVVGWTWFEQTQAYSPLALSGNGKFGFFRGKEFGEIEQVSEGEFFDIRQGEWQDPRVSACSYDGQTAIGLDTGRAFIWRRGVGFVNISELVGTADVVPLSISSDGETVTLRSSQSTDKVYVYTSDVGLETLASFLTRQGVDLTGWARFDFAYLGGHNEGIVVAGIKDGSYIYAHGWYKGSHLTVDLSRARVLPGGALKGKVIFAEPKSYGRRVILTSSSSNMTIDSDAWVPAGKTVASLTVRTSAGSPGDRYTVNAASEDLSASDDLEVIAYFKTLSLTPTVAFDHYPITLTATLDRVSNVAVPLSVGYSLYVNGAPQKVTVPAGASLGKATFTPAIGYSMVAPTALTVTVQDSRAPYAVTKTATMTLYPVVDSLSINPASIGSNGSGTGTIGIGRPAPAGGITYHVSASDAIATVPSTVSMPAGAMTVGFNIGVGVVSTQKTITVQARYGNSFRATTFRAVP